MLKLFSGYLPAALVVLCGCNNPTSHSTKAENPPYEQGAVQSTERGKKIFEERCKACHGENGDYRNNNAADLQVSRIDSISIVRTIINGRGAMPMFDHAIADSDLGQLEIYVKSLRK